MTGIIAALAGSGSRFAGSATVTVGTYYDPNPSFSFRFWGYDDGLIGSVSPSTWANTGLTISDLKYAEVYTTPTQWVNFQVLGSAPNSGWETMTVNGTPLSRSAASYTNNGTDTTWTWFGAANSFGTTAGATKVVTWA